MKNLLVPSNLKSISLCKTICKIAGKILINKFKFIMPKLISKEQASFIRGRSLLEHVLIAKEVFQKFRFSKALKCFVSFKIDMEQD